MSTLSARCLAEIDRRLQIATDLGFRPEHHRDWPYLLAFRTILTEHEMDDSTKRPECTCGQYVAFPCPTIRALATALGVT